MSIAASLTSAGPTAQRRRRFDPLARSCLRPVRPEADPRPRAARPGAVRWRWRHCHGNGVVVGDVEGANLQAVARPKLGAGDVPVIDAGGRDGRAEVAEQVRNGRADVASATDDDSMEARGQRKGAAHFKS
jgi:hypothetical protein